MVSFSASGDRKSLCELLSRSIQAVTRRVSFPPALLDPAQTSAEIMSGETRLSEARRGTRQREVAQLSERQHQAQAEIDGTVSQLAALGEQVTLLIDEHKDQQSLLDKGLTQRGRVLALQRQVARMKGQIDGLRAPFSGIVHDLRVNAPKSVVTPAETVMFIMPGDEDLVVRSRIGAAGIDQDLGQSAVVVFPAFDQRMTSESARISTDAFAVETSGRRYYEVELRPTRMSPKSSVGRSLSWPCRSSPLSRHPRGRRSATW